MVFQGHQRYIETSTQNTWGKELSDWKFEKKELNKRN